MAPNSVDVFAQALAFEGIGGDSVSLDQVIELVKLDLNRVERLARKGVSTRPQCGHIFETICCGDVVDLRIAVGQQQLSR